MEYQGMPYGITQYIFDGKHMLTCFFHDLSMPKSLEDVLLAGSEISVGVMSLRPDRLNCIFVNVRFGV